ncbi:MAG: hypothetical protein JWN44_7104 [Myxococcales bacterium]|nr:hypothetical protein [Myxococcales bacterium]
MNGRAIAALWIICAGLVAWVWLRPMHDGTLPAPVTRAARKTRVDPHRSSVAAPEDEPAAEEPAAAPVHAGPPEQLNRHDLETAIDKVKPKVMGCRDVEQFTGFLTVRLVIEKSGSLKSASVLPPVDKTRTAECVRHALRGLSFPKFRGTWVPQIEWSYPFWFSEK